MKSLASGSLSSKHRHGMLSWLTFSSSAFAMLKGDDRESQFGKKRQLLFPRGLECQSRHCLSYCQEGIEHGKS
jgi:hypothetical protein